MDFEYKKFPKKLNLGCGFDKKEGYLNVDINPCHEPDLVGDVTNLYMLPDRYYEHLIAKDILEHIPRLRIRNTLKEWNRILQDNALLELQVPNVVGLLSLLQKKSNQKFHQQEQLLQCLFGTQSYHGDFHYIGFTDVFIKGLLEETGFYLDKLCHKDEWLFEIKACKSKHCFVDSMFYLSDEDFLEEVYERYLRRSPDPEGKSYYLGLIKKGIAREAVIESIIHCDEYIELSI